MSAPRVASLRRRSIGEQFVRLVICDKGKGGDSYFGVIQLELVLQHIARLSGDPDPIVGGNEGIDQIHADIGPVGIRECKPVTAQRCGGV